jgi:hypothetical protein
LFKYFLGLVLIPIFPTENFSKIAQRETLHFHKI